MVFEQIVRRGISNTRVLMAMSRTPRHEFVPEAQRGKAYDDQALAIGHGQTISQPYVVAFMTEALALPERGARVLEIGTGCGFQAAVLAELGAEVDTIEIVPALAESARERLARLGYTRVTVYDRDGYEGIPERAPYDAILLAAAPREIPLPLVEQLAMGGRLIAPVGADVQRLVLLTREAQGVSRRELLTVRFVPMTGRATNAS